MKTRWVSPYEWWKIPANNIINYSQKKGLEGVGKNKVPPELQGGERWTTPSVIFEKRIMPGESPLEFELRRSSPVKKYIRVQEPAKESQALKGIKAKSPQLYEKMMQGNNSGGVVGYIEVEDDNPEWRGKMKERAKYIEEQAKQGHQVSRLNKVLYQQLKQVNLDEQIDSKPIDVDAVIKDMKQKAKAQFGDNTQMSTGKTYEGYGEEQYELSESGIPHIGKVEGTVFRKDADKYRGWYEQHPVYRGWDPKFWYGKGYKTQGWGSFMLEGFGPTSLAGAVGAPLIFGQIGKATAQKAFSEAMASPGAKKLYNQTLNKALAGGQTQAAANQIARQTVQKYASQIATQEASKMVGYAKTGRKVLTKIAKEEEKK